MRKGLLLFAWCLLANSALGARRSGVDEFSLAAPTSGKAVSSSGVFSKSPYNIAEILWWIEEGEKGR